MIIKKANIFFSFFSPLKNKRIFEFKFYLIIFVALSNKFDYNCFSIPIFHIIFHIIGIDMSEYHVNYNGVEYTIDPIIFSQCSPVFKQFYNPNETMNIKYELPAEAFEQFLPAVQGKPIQITRDNVSNLKSFAIEWKASDLLKKIEEFEFVHSINSTLENFQNNISRNQPVDKMIPSLAQNIDLLIKNPQFARVPQKYMKLILENPKCDIKNYHAFFKFIIGYANLQKSPKEKSILNYIDVSRLDISEINQLFDINIISVQNPMNNSNIPDLLKNLAFHLHDAYQDSTKRALAATEHLKSKEASISKVFGDIKKTRKLISDTQHQIDEKKRKDSQPPPPPQTRRYPDRPRRDPYQNRPPMSKKDMVYSPSANSNNINSDLH